MKNRLTLYSFLISLLFVSCDDKNVFTISGDISNPGSITKVYLIGADSSTLQILDSTTLSGGSFKFKHSAPAAGMYKLRIGGSMFDLIAKNNNHITFRTDINDSTRTYTITGSDESEKIKEFNKIDNGYTEQTTKLFNEYQAAAQSIGGETPALINEFRPKFIEIAAAQGDGTLKFVTDNENSLAGFYAALTLDSNKYEQQLIAYADVIKDKFKDNIGVQQFVKQMESVKPISIGQPAPDFTIVGFDDKPIKLSAYKGKYVLLDFWASWCAPCRQENPNVVKQYATYHARGLNILGISLDNDKAKWQSAIAADNLSWTHASDLKGFEGGTERLYHINAIPSNYIIDPKGIIIAKNVRGKDLEEFLNKTFSKPE